MEIYGAIISKEIWSHSSLLWKASLRKGINESRLFEKEKWPIKDINFQIVKQELSLINRKFHRCEKLIHERLSLYAGLFSFSLANWMITNINGAFIYDVAGRRSCEMLLSFTNNDAPCHIGMIMIIYRQNMCEMIIGKVWIYLQWDEMRLKYLGKCCD